MKAGEWLYLCVAHGNDGAMEVRNACLYGGLDSKMSHSNVVQSTTFCIPLIARLRC